MRAPEIEGIAGVTIDYRDAPLTGQLKQAGESGCLLYQAHPQFARSKVRDHARHTADVVGVAVSDGDGIEALQAAVPKVRRDHLLPDIELRDAWAEHAASIHQQGATFGSDDEGRIALADINGCYFKGASVNAGASRRKGDPKARCHQEYRAGDGQ